MLVYRVDVSDKNVWQNNAVNINPNNTCYQLLLASGFKGAASPYDPFPGGGRVKYLLNNTTPANLLSHKGNPCDFVITHITENDSIISFKLQKADMFSFDSVPNIASLLNLTSYEDYKVQLKDAQVYVVANAEKKSEVLARDATGNISLIHFGLDVQPGDTLNGCVYATYIDEDNWLVLNNLNGFNNADSIQVTNGEAPKPRVVTFQELDSCHVMDYIKMEGVTLDYRTIHDKESLCIINGEHFIGLNTKYFYFDIQRPSKEEVSGKLYDVEGVICYYNIPEVYDLFVLTAPLTPSDETAIRSITTSHNDAKTIHNLNGQRISSLQKGLNIVNGKKVWMK